MKTPIPVYAPNLKFRTDRKESILSQFDGKDEFDLTVVPAIELRNGPWALWQTFYGIVEKEAAKGSPYFIFCEDDHIFTEEYSFENLAARIEEAQKLEADLLSGGMSWIKHPVQVSEHLFWVSKFNGMQFTVIFNRLYQRILDCKTTEGYVVDFHLSYLAKRKFVIYPYISVQKEFGYSDATRWNGEAGRVANSFKHSLDLLEKLAKVKAHYSQTPSGMIASIWEADVSKFYLPAYVINLPERTDRRQHIERQFAKRPEFSLHFVEACRHEVGAVGLWKSICQIVFEADASNEDAVLICEDDHFFTEHYDRNTFLHQVMQAGAMGAQLLSGGIGGFSNLVPVGHGLSWMNDFWCTQFIVIFRSAFKEMLETHFSIRDTADGKLSEILTEKLVITPFISEQADMGYSDVTSSNNKGGGITRYFDECKMDLKHYEFAQHHILGTEPYATSFANVTEYLAQRGIHALQIGCGQHLIESWYNTDVEPTYGAQFLDATQPFPIGNQSFDYILAEHFLEHIPYHKGFPFLQECYRTLKTGGVLRLTLSSIDRIMHFYQHPQEADAQKYAQWCLKQFSPRTYGEWTKRRNAMPMPFALGVFMTRFKDTLLYDIPSLEGILQAAGFRNIELCPLDESSHRALHKTGNAQSLYSPQWVQRMENIALEATK